MLRRSYLVIFPMLILSTLLLTYQWSMYVYGDQTTNTSTGTPDMHIQVNHTNEKLSVTQKITNLQAGTYTFFIPSNAKEIKCENGAGEPCLTQEKEVTVSEDQQIRWSYQLQYKKDEKVYSDWYIKLQKNNRTLPMNMNVEVIEKHEPFWKWAAPAKLEADIEKDYIRYYRWTSDQAEALPLLHMSEGPYQLHQEDGLYIYSKNSLGDNYKKLLQKWRNSPFEGPFIVIVNPDLQETIGERHIIVPDLNQETIQKYWLEQSLQSSYNTQNTWLVTMLTHYFYNISPQDKKTNKMVNALSTNLSKKQKQEFLQLALEAETDNLAKDLDRDLQKIYEKPTPFFDLNQNRNEPFVPLYFIENKTITVEGKKVDVAWKPILYNQHRYYPLAGISSLFEFELVALPSESLYIMRKNGESWRFSLNKKTFVHNQENFGVVTDVLEKVQGEVFIREKYIEELLGIRASEGSYSIDLKY